MATTTSPSRYTPTGAGFQNPNFPNPMGPYDARVIIYGCLVHVLQLVRYKTWSFSPLALACFLETVGYIFRSLSSKDNPYHIIWFVVQYFMIVVAPVFISASIYVCINKLITWAKSVGYVLDQWWLSPKLILWGFVTVDVLTTILQIAGAALIGSSQSNQKDPATGNNILLAGLAVQSFSFTIFLAVLSLFRFALFKHPEKSTAVRAKDWFIAALAIASLLVYLRTLFRLSETAQGLFSHLSIHEVYFGTLEFSPVVLAVWILAVWHPGRWLPYDTAAASRTSRVESSSGKEKPRANV
ncbi:MAG: hypothetical protein L6R35_002568 [Caloplaca aegaea]|nr:MAG: hypothetical protein L6R35_002568 [Caloplaca aegaea]